MNHTFSRKISKASDSDDDDDNIDLMTISCQNVFEDFRRRFFIICYKLEKIGYCGLNHHLHRIILLHNLLFGKVQEKQNWILTQF